MSGSPPARRSGDRAAAKPVAPPAAAKKAGSVRAEETSGVREQAGGVLTEEAGSVRAEDAFDVEAVHAWLREQSAVELPGAPPEVRQFSGGASNLTYLLRYPDCDLILRRPPAGAKAASAHDMEREFRIQQALAPVYPYVPGMVALCRDATVIGGDFYVMRRIHGTILRSRMPAQLALDADATRRLSRSAVQRLVELHAIDPHVAGLAYIGRGPGYVRRQVQGWSERYRAARTWNVPRFERVMRWLDERQPQDARLCVIHNDFRLDNLVLAPRASSAHAGTPSSPSPDSPGSEGRGPDRPVRSGAAPDWRIVGVLDWEMATVGDPLMDLGGALAYWVQADDDRFMRALRRQPTDAPGMLTRREILDLYEQSTGMPLADWTFYEVFGLFRLATIIQQIYRRYHLRQTRNPAFRHYWLAVRYLSWRCRRLIRRAI